jgi:1,4-alpha-glucan branching enzyme
MLENGAARRVTLVGDFNNWNPAATPLTRDPASGLWTTVVPMLPGRHVYAFMIDDSVLMLDPRAPKTKDPSLGVEGSVVIVGRP